jgi:DNA-binding LytR/AlgR family response regulator
MKEDRRPKFLIVDDSKVARITLRKLLEKVGNINIVGECEDAPTAKSFIEKNDIDILFLDVEMPGMNGLELLRVLTQRPLTILTTAKPGYAVEAFELNVVDYLVKPFDLSRIMISIERARELFNNQDSQLSNDFSSEFLFIKDSKTIRKIKYDEILWIEAKGDYAKIYLPDNSYVIHGSLKTVEDRFPPSKFIRVHRSYLVAFDKIDYIEDRIVFIHNQPIPISESQKEVLLKKLNLL